MKEFVKLKDVAIEIAGETVVERVSGTVRAGDIIGLIGRNGSGKSTFLQVMSGLRQPTKGHVQMNAKTCVFVEQECLSFEDAYVTEALRENWHIPAVPYVQLSGGEKLKLRLAVAFDAGAELLLLDEPTNHLDEASVEQVIEQVKRYEGALVIVSHDRYFLDQVATKIWALEARTLTEQEGNYTHYEQVRAHNRKTQQRAYEKQQREITAVEEEIVRIAGWSQKAHKESTKQEFQKEFYRKKAKQMDKQIKSKRKRLEQKLEQKVAPVAYEYDVQFTLQHAGKVGKRFVEAKNLSKQFRHRRLFEQSHFTIGYGEKLAFVGANGSGKTTLLNILLGRETTEGELWISPTARIGYLTQEVFDLPEQSTPAQFFYQVNFEARGKVQNLMKHLGFQVEHWQTKFGEMSMGERVKCKLMQFILEDCDVLVLDEPTNHLDLPSREQLERTLAAYSGTLIIVSHDRYFREKLATATIEIKDTRICRRWVEQKNEVTHDLLTLETERQAVLGKLSFEKVGSAAYNALDAQFIQLTKEINRLKK